MTIETHSKGSPAQNEAVRKPEDYRKALELAEAGQHAEALQYMQEYLCSAPDDAEALNDTGTILHCLGRSDEAVDHLVRARSLQPESAEIIWNLSETYLAAGKATEATGLFDDMDRMGVLSADVLNRTADVFLGENNLADAARMLNWSLELCPDQKILRPMIQVIRHKMAENKCE